MKHITSIFILALAACGGSPSRAPMMEMPDPIPPMMLDPVLPFAPIFENSVASNDVDFITVNDPSVFEAITFDGQSTQEMPSDLREGLFLDDTFIFNASFADGTTVPIWLDPSIGDQTVVEDLATTIATRVGQLPENMRAPLGHIVVNAGDSAAAEEAAGGFFILYADNVQTRLENNDLSETIFHESAHVSLQGAILTSPEWLEAVAADPGLITNYAGTNAGEDFAETALFAYAYLNFPDRLPPEVIEAIETNIPNRVEALETVLELPTSP